MTGSLDLRGDPLPDLPGNRLDKYGNGYWDFPSLDVVPLDFVPVVRLIEQKGTTKKRS